MLGAVLLDDAGLCRDDLLQGTTILIHDDQDVCDCVYEAVARILADDVRLLMHGTWFDAYDESVNDGTPIVIVTFERAVVYPRDAMLLADRVIDLGDVGRPQVVAALTKAVIGKAVRLSPDEAAYVEAASLMRWVQLAGSDEHASCDLMVSLKERRIMTLATEATAVPRSPRRTDLSV